MTTLLRVAIILLGVTLLQPDRRVFLLSLDALGHQRLTTDPVAQELTTLQTLLKAGAHADGLTPAFPSTTANGHAALWTGTYAGHNGILYNSTPPFPRRDHVFTDRVVGFRSEALTAEPIWLTASRQHVSVVAHQVTQAVPFLPQTVGTAPTGDLAVVNGYQSRTFAKWRAVRSSNPDVNRTPCDAWPPTTTGPNAACYEWPLGLDGGNTQLRAAVLRDRILMSTSTGSPAVEVEWRRTETEPPRRRPLARYWSRPLAVDGLPDRAPASVVFRALEIDPERRSFLLLQSPLQETAVYSSDETMARAMVNETGPMIGNGAGGLYSSGALGVPAAEGGSGEAERRYLETLELVVKQQMAQSTWLFHRRRPRLHISYLPTADEVDHAWYGLDRAGDRRYTELRRWGYAALEHGVRAFVSLAAADDHVIVTSDHGMAAISHLFAVDQVLADAGMSGLASPVNTCLLLNTTDWKAGTIPPESRDAAIARVRAVLEAPRTPSGDRIVTRIYSSRAEMADFGHDGPGGADVCFDLAPGIGPTDSSKTGVLAEARPPRGMHGFDPTRADMKAVLLLRGPRAEPGRSLGSLKSAVVAPLIADLLGIDPPRDATSASPLSRSDRR